VQGAGCTADADARLRDARARVEAFDVPGALDDLQAAAAAGCADAAVARWYLTGVQTARAAYKVGGDPESLAPARDAEAALGRSAGTGNTRAEIARLVVLAASAAAQSERDDLGVFLDQALQLESVELAHGRGAAPVLPAHEVAGDLWLQVHRFDAARAAYLAAAAAFGATPRVTLGLARVAVRLQDAAAACAQYATLLQRWAGRLPVPQEIDEARAFVRANACSRTAR
jgi:hypothetical protein